MDRFGHKTKKDKHVKHVDKEKSNTFITDIKTIKENLKINEILQTVKMNSSMRIKAPREHRVMQDKDFIDDFSDDSSLQLEEDDSQVPSGKKTEAINNNTDVSDSTITEDGTQIINDIDNANDEIPFNENTNESEIVQDKEPKIDQQDTSITEKETDCPDNQSNDKSSHQITLDETPAQALPTKEDMLKKILTRNDSTLLRDRKLSLDHSLLLRRESLSQSEIDLHSMGKSPLERKSSFFRKKMDNFLKNTTEIFRRHSSHYKAQPGVQRRGSMSVSLQSLHEDTCPGDFEESLGDRQTKAAQGSVSSLKSSSFGGSSQSVGQQAPGRPLREMVSSQPVLCGSQPTIGRSTENINCLSGAYAQDSLLSSRAISMSSGLDSAHGRRQSTRSKRVTWVASEGLNNYLRRLIQDEKKIDNMQGSHSFQDFSSIKENVEYSYRTDTKGRRLSYQRAVSGEDPVAHKHSLRRGNAHAVNSDILEQLANFSLTGIPSIRGYTPLQISPEAELYKKLAACPEVFESFFEWKIHGVIGPPPPIQVAKLEKTDFFHKLYEKPLNKNELERQAVIRELIVTEVDYLRHLTAIVEVFIASAHALQDTGRLLDLDTEKLFVNIPDVLNASNAFYEATIVPMITDAIENNVPFNTEYMAPGFCRFRELFQPYERYVGEQSRALDYLRALATHPEFMMYLCWCHRQKSCRRLQLSDIMVKPMQRLTKYSLILRRIISHTDFEPERTSLIAMDSFATNYVLDLNRSIRQREELEIIEHLATIIESYELEFKDEDLDRAFRMFAQINLRAPMQNSLPNHSRSLIHQGDLKFRDHTKELDVHVFLLTDMMLICKKHTKGIFSWKMVRPKYMVDKVIVYPKYNSKTSKDIQSLVFIGLDEVGSSVHGFTLTELKEKDPNPQNSLKMWEQKFKEAKLTYELGVWYAKNPSRDLSEVEMDTSSDYAVSGSSKGKQNSDDLNIEREARERVAAMLHRSMGASTEYDCSQGSMATDSFDGEGSHASCSRHMYNLRHPMYRTSTGGSSRNSRLSSFHQSTSAASHEEPQPGPSSRADYYRAGTSVEHFIPPMNPDDAVTSITVNVVSESESETVVPSMPPPSLQSVTGGSRNTLRVQPASGIMALVHSLPDLTFEPPHHPPPQAHSHCHSHTPSPQSASEKLYQSHNELLQRNRLQALNHQHYLTPDHRGTSYPPPSPTRASLKRGLAFSYSLKNPPLYKMGHVNSQSAQPTVHCDPANRNERIGVTNPLLIPPTAGPSNKQQSKKDKHLNRHKGGNSSRRDREDKGD